MNVKRYNGTCEELARIDANPLIEWILAIPYEEWPQQPKLPDGKLRPAMTCDPNWHNFKAKAGPLVNTLMTLFPDCLADTRMLSAVMPGHNIAPHKDEQSANWRVRVHVPLLTNPQSQFIVGGVSHHLEPGKAYLVNTEAEHAVDNGGPTPRVHFMFDVRLW